MRQGRDPLRGSSVGGRWSEAGGFEVLYTSLAREGALAEVGYRLSLEPVWPNLARHSVHTLDADVQRTLRFADVASLAPFGVDPGRYQSFDYGATQAIAAAAHFLEYDGLIVPSARGAFHNLVVFMDRLAPGALAPATSEAVDWAAWRAASTGRRAL